VVFCIFVEQSERFYTFVILKKLEMETLVLKSNSKKDLSLLLQLAKEKGLKLEVASEKGLNTPVIAEKTISKAKQIAELSKEVNKAMHKKLMQEYNTYNDSNYR